MSKVVESNVGDEEEKATPRNLVPEPTLSWAPRVTVWYSICHYKREDPKMVYQWPSTFKWSKDGHLFKLCPVVFRFLQIKTQMIHPSCTVEYKSRRAGWSRASTTNRKLLSQPAYVAKKDRARGIRNRSQRRTDGASPTHLAGRGR